MAESKSVQLMRAASIIAEEAQIAFNAGDFGRASSLVTGATQLMQLSEQFKKMENSTEAE